MVDFASRTFVASLIVGLVGCSDTSTMFTGLWVSTEVMDDAPLEGRPELAIGHFGPELTGIAFFNTAQRVPPVDPGTCPCAFIDHLEVDLAEGSFKMATTHCDGVPWVWALRHSEDDEGIFLTGELLTDDGQASIPVRFQQEDTFIANEKKECVR